MFYTIDLWCGLERLSTTLVSEVHVVLLWLTLCVTVQLVSRMRVMSGRAHSTMVWTGHRRVCLGIPIFLLCRKQTTIVMAYQLLWCFLVWQLGSCWTKRQWKPLLDNIDVRICIFAPLKREATHSKTAILPKVLTILTMSPRKKFVLSGTVSNEVHKRAQASLSLAFTLARGTSFSSQFEEMQQRVMGGLIRIQKSSWAKWAD